MLCGVVQYVIGMVWYVRYVYTCHTYDVLPQHRITYKYIDFLPNFNLNITLGRL